MNLTSSCKKSKAIEANKEKRALENMKIYRQLILIRCMGKRLSVVIYKKYYYASKREAIVRGELRI